MSEQFVIIGCGRFGSAVAQELTKLGREVMIVDVDQDVVQNMSNIVTYAVQADVTDANTVKTLGIGNFDTAIVTMGANIQGSMLATLLVKETGVKKVISKAQSKVHSQILYKIGADRVIFPEREMGIRLAKNLVSKNVLEFIELSEDYSVIELRVTEDWIGKTLEELDMRKKYGVNVVAIKNLNDVNISVLGSYEIQENDRLVVIGQNENLNQFEKKEV
ncbi:MAG TPA: TrkA family potassium uptake protein [Clostridia bacterium]|nr:TrkA family potassium uptake protein [Clostridia bacterium]